MLSASASRSLSEESSQANSVEEESSDESNALDGNVANVEINLGPCDDLVVGPFVSIDQL